MALKRKRVDTSRHQTKAAAAVTTVTKVKVARGSSAVSIAKKSFAGLIEHKEKISTSLREGKNLTDIKGIRFVKPF
ncbi:hypothetical protein [Pedobacter deserti]|uniref:hypothetical protein n=1 Tax=Pedobacter deserti TaxID=2817382 RepID=UPI00210E8C16|nr:hypothetical protein [Pedobacter sp. SYSU D00382]